jgi:hypothetical protein
LSKRQPDLDVIAAAADAAAANQDKASDEERLQAIEDRLANIEPLLEQLQANSALSTQLSDYVKDLRSEQDFFNKARWAVGCLALIAIIAITLLLALAIFHVSSPLLKAPAAAIAAVILGLVSGVVLLISAFVKGVFRSTAERHSDGFLPPALEKSGELLVKLVSGKNPAS